MKNRIIYIYDALCGWCYGFSPVMMKIYEKYKNELDFDVLSGGMVLGERAGEIGKVAGYISKAYQQVETTTGVKFGEGFLKNVLEPGTAWFSSEKLGVAMTVFKQLLPQHALPFAHDLQQAVYEKGTDMNIDINYLPLLEKYKINPSLFMSIFKSEDALERTKDEFQFVSEMGITGFPTVLFAKGSEGFVITRGYQSFKCIETAIEQLLSEN